jgi:ABC-type lipoprotein release transport system permease subunit
MKYRINPKQLSLIAIVSIAIILFGAAYVVVGSVMQRVPRSEVAETSNEPLDLTLDPAEKSLPAKLSPAHTIETPSPQVNPPQPDTSNQQLAQTEKNKRRKQQKNKDPEKTDQAAKSRLTF